MFKTIDHPADCEIRSVIRFLTVKNVSAAENHRQISDSYGPNAVSSSKVYKWVRVFKNGLGNVHDEPRSGRSSFGWEQIDHLPYSPDLVPSDFHLFRSLKEFLGGKRFATDDEQFMTGYRHRRQTSTT